MIRVYRWHPASRTSDCPAPDQLPATAADVAGDAVVWIDLDDPTPEEEDRVLRRFLPVHPLTLDDITRPRVEADHGAHLPKAEQFPDYLFVVVNPLPWSVCNGAGAGGTGDAHPPARLNRRQPQLSAVMTHTVLVTHHYDRLPCVESVWSYIGRRGDAAGKGPDYLFHLILDEMVDEYAPVLDRLIGRLDRIEARVFRRPSPRVLSRLLRLKRTVVYLRKTLIMEREVLARLTRREFALVSEREAVYYRNVYDHLVRYTELIEGAREMVSDLMQTHLSAMSNRLNEVMKVLTMISTIGLFCTLIAGIYGMNFEYMPELHWRYGYPFALSLMGIAAGGSIWFFRRKGWI